MSRSGNIWKGPDLVLRLECNGRIIHEGRVSELAFPIQIGRKSVCLWNVPPDEKSVSGVHAEIFVRRKRELMIRDLGSKNGIFVMGAKVQERHLADGVQVGMGQCRLFVEGFRDDSAGKKARYHRLEQLTGPGSPRFFDLKNATTIIGSGVSDGILCADLLVSKEHAKVECKSDDSCWISDLASRNGTSVNQVPLKTAERMLCNGDIVTIADIEFKFWDRSAPQADSLVRKVIVAVITVCVCAMSYFGFQWMCPSAKSMLATAQRYEMEGRFSLAKSILDKALTARGGDEYREEIKRKHDDIERWRTTLTSFEEAKKEFAKRRWVSVSPRLGALLDPSIDKWGWNTTTAHERKRQARMMYVAVQTFLEARRALAGDFPEEAIGHEREHLVRQCEAMSAVLANPEWTDSLPTGKLRVDMEAQLSAVKATVDDLDEVERRLADVKPPVQDSLPLAEAVALTDGFHGMVEAFSRISANAERREKEFEKEARAVKRKYVSSPIVRSQCDRFIPVLRKFVESREKLLANVDCIGRLDETNLQQAIPFPSDQQCSLHPAFGGIRRAMQEANRRICKTLMPETRDQVSRLKRWVDGDAKTPKCVERLFDEKTMDAVFACDTIAGPYCKSSRKVRSGMYDTVLGIEEFAEFLLQPEERNSDPESASDAPVPLVFSAMKCFRQSAAFARYLGTPDMQYVLSRCAIGAKGLKEMAENTIELDAKRKIVVDAWFNRESESRRERIVAMGAALLLDAEGALGADGVATLNRELGELRREVRTLESRLEGRPEEVDVIRPRIVSTGLPKLFGVNRHWDQEEKARRGR